jgi:hypothetical protein
VNFEGSCVIYCITLCIYYRIYFKENHSDWIDGVTEININVALDISGLLKSVHAEIITGVKHGYYLNG